MVLQVFWRSFKGCFFFFFFILWTFTAYSSIFPPVLFLMLFIDLTLICESLKITPTLGDEPVLCLLKTDNLEKTESILAHFSMVFIVALKDLMKMDGIIVEYIYNRLTVLQCHVRNASGPSVYTSTDR